MLNASDLFGKSVLSAAFGVAATVEREREVPPGTAQRADLLVAPDPAREDARIRLGLLGQMISGVCLVEIFSRPPGPEQIRSCVLKQLGYHQHGLRTSRRGRQPAPELPRLWVISAAPPRKVLAGFGFEPRPPWPAGFYGRAPLDALGLVVVPELPATRDTLLLRMLGRGVVLQQALTELRALGSRSWEWGVAVPGLLAVRAKLPYSNDDPEGDVRMQVERIYEEMVREIEARAEARAEARVEAQAEARWAAIGVGRGVLAVAESRGLPVTDADRARIETNLDIARAQRWLQRVTVASTMSEVFEGE